MNKLLVVATIAVASVSFAQKKDTKAPEAAKEAPAAAPKDIVDTAVAAGSFKTLATALTEAGLIDTLKGAGPFTVFAPTDCAFAALDPATLEAALADPTGLLTTVLGFHVIPERLSAADLAGMTELTTFTGEVLMVSVEGDAITVNGTTMVVVGEIQTANATVYLVDSVMLPPSVTG